MKLQELVDDTVVSLNLVLLSKETIPSRMGKVRLEMTFSDGTDRVRMLAWNAVDFLNAKLQVNTTYLLSGNKSIFRLILKYIIRAKFFYIGHFYISKTYTTFESKSGFMQVRDYLY